MSNFINRPLPLSKSKAIDQQLIKMIVKEYHPFSVVEDKEFRKLINMLSPNYIIPSRKTVSNSLLPQMYETVVQNVKRQLENVSAICLTTDGWTSITNQSFVAVTAHFIDPKKDYEISTVLLGCTDFPQSHTGDNLAIFLKNIVAEWGLSQHVAAVVTDNAANMKAAIEKCKWRQLSCFAHSINLVVQSGLMSIEHVTKKVKDIVTYFKKSLHGLSKLQELQRQTRSSVLKLKQDCPTRWNSTYDMLDRIFELKESIVATCAILNISDLNSLSEQDWIVIEKSKNILKIFYDLTIEISSKHMKTMNIISQATLLDPRFKKHGFIHAEKCSTTIRNLRSKVQSIRVEENTIPQPNVISPSVSLPTSSTAIWEDFDETVVNIIGGNNSTAAGIIEVDKYLNEPLLRRDENPLLWWSERKKVYPLLYEIVKRRLCIMATSVPCERIFSKAGQVVTNRRRDRFVRTALIKGGRTNNFVEGDLRGKHGNKKKLAPEIINQICDHINSFARIESHYLRNQTSREFIDGSLLQKCRDCLMQNVKLIKYHLVNFLHTLTSSIPDLIFFIPKRSVWIM
ncbi:zinc finger BED domain-containing protein 1-like [Acyrthosiphon pisum]|uniref:HAT C-terminal dimerisation domain-containing protein n=1 Tax=Acyrthosiphon pisum TaxID=7029 RepID=A0A8R2JKX3_ACYPI|nr:zinc finger BED domain-containing protein 1-like [Acyrthosiphon pisum]